MTGGDGAAADPGHPQVDRDGLAADERRIAADRCRRGVRSARDTCSPL